jgi:hypothetical protein
LLEQQQSLPQRGRATHRVGMDEPFSAGSEMIVSELVLGDRRHGIEPDVGIGIGIG